jgi:hypothetical protein
MGGLAKLKAIRRHLRARRSWEKLLLEKFETADPRFVVLRSEVIEHCAAKLGHGAGVKDAPFGAEVRRWARRLGWVAINPQNRNLFRGVKRRGFSDEVELRRAKLLRDRVPRERWDVP